MADRGKGTQLKAKPLSASRGRGRWFAGYLILSIVSIATIAGAIMLSHHLVRQHASIHRENLFWSRHPADHAVLETLLAEADDRRLTGVDDIHFGTVAAANRLVEGSQPRQEAPLRGQMEPVRYLRTIYLVLGTFVVLLVLGLTAYGYRISRQMKRSSMELTAQIASLEENLRDATLQAEQANDARTRFFAAASHDLRQPLHTISLYLPLLMKQMEHDKGREMLEAIRNSCTAMQSLLDSLLDISRLDAGDIQPQTGPVSLLETFDQLGLEFASQAAAKGLEFRVVPVDYWVRSDPALLRRILRNLLSNAIRYTRQGKVLLGARHTGKCVRIEVWDSGIGIDREALNHIFEEFYQGDDTESDRSRGLGLGLAITQRLADLLEGHRLGARSWPGRGSVFDLTLPATDDPYAHTGDAPNRSGASGLEGRRALLIDDDAIVLEGTEAMLQDWGLDVIAANSISDATIRIAESGASPDIVIADLRLRGSESGLDAIMTLNETLQRPVPAIIVTGDTDPRRTEQISASGLTILHKPVEPTRLHAALVEAMKGYSGAEEEETGSADLSAVEGP